MFTCISFSFIHLQLTHSLLDGVTTVKGSRVIALVQRESACPTKLIAILSLLAYQVIAQVSKHFVGAQL